MNDFQVYISLPTFHFSSQKLPLLQEIRRFPIHIYLFKRIYTCYKALSFFDRSFFIHPSFRLTYTIYVELVENKFGTYTCTVYTIQFRI